MTKTSNTTTKHSNVFDGIQFEAKSSQVTQTDIHDLLDALNQHHYQSNFKTHPKIKEWLDKVESRHNSIFEMTADEVREGWLILEEVRI